MQYYVDFDRGKPLIFIQDFELFLIPSLLLTEYEEY